MKKKTIIKICTSCNESFSLPFWLSKINKTCSKQCGYLYIKIRNKNRNVCFCKTCEKSFKKKSGSRGLFCSKMCYWNSKNRLIDYKCIGCNKIISSCKGVLRCNKCFSETNKGENHWNWKGGNRSRDIHSLFNPQYVEWRTSVFSRDNYKCRIADKNCSGQLEAHHILPWRDFVELRYQINNGITLCHAHHPRKVSEEKRLSPYFQELVSVSN